MDETVKVILYVIGGLVVLYILMAIAIGVNPVMLVKKMNQKFEPGKLYVTNTNNEQNLEAISDVEYSESSYIITLHGPKFHYEGDSDSALKFIILLDFHSLLFVGTHSDGQEIIECSPESGSLEFNCAQNLELKFDLGRRTGTITGKQNLHFMAWSAKPAVVDAAKQDTATLSSMLESYADSYISSFDVAVDFSMKLEETGCKKLNEQECRDNNNEGCYWGGPWYWYSSCGLCPSSTKCIDYRKDQCAQCPVPKANCEPGILWGCEVI